MRLLLLCLLFALPLPGQLTPLGSVGTGQTVPDPYFVPGTPGTALLNGVYCTGGATAGLTVAVRGIPLGYNTGPMVTNETIFVALDVGPATTPGTTILGGQFYLPFTNAQSFTAGQSLWLGPGDIVTCPGFIALAGPPLSVPNNGARVNLGLIPAGVTGTFSLQGYLFDPALGRVFTTNALNFQVP